MSYECVGTNLHSALLLKVMFICFNKIKGKLF